MRSLFAFGGKLGFIGELAQTLRDCFVHLFKGGAPRAVARSRARSPCIRPFLLLAFLWACFGKEKRLKSFGIKG